MSKKNTMKTGTALATATLVGVMGAIGSTTASATPEKINTQGNLALHNKLLSAPLQKARSNSVYQVRSGDTLWNISRKFHVSIQAIANANNLRNVNIIYPGQKLLIPNGKVTATPAAPATKPAPSTARVAPQTNISHSATYVVKRGDTLWSIARAHGTSIRNIVAANRISNSSLIYPGQRLIMPGKNTSPAATPAATKPKPTPAAPATPAPQAKPALPTPPAPAVPAAPAPKPAVKTGITYIVKRGDTLWSIARAHGTSVNAIVQQNRIANSSFIFVGQRLIIGGTATQPSAPTGKKQQLVKNNFPGYTYPDSTVAAANENKHALINSQVPSKAEVQSMIINTARQMGVDPRLALAHAFVESGFDATAVSPANAIGTMQVIPSSGVWASQLVGRTLNLLNPADNITAGIAIIRALQNSANSLEEGIAGYYQGLGGVRRNGMRPDTVRYVAKVKAAMNRF